MLGLGNSDTWAHYWLPGDDTWSDYINVGGKRETLAVSIRGNTEVVAMNSRAVSNTSVRNIAYYNGVVHRDEWTKPPEKHFQAAVIAWDDADSIYVFGGARDAPSPKVFKFEISQDRWTELDPMPSGGGAFPSCGMANYANAVSVICLGTKIDLDNNIEIFNLETEEWGKEENVLTPANPPTYGSLVFSRGSKLYRVRGYYASDEATNSYDILDLDTLSWESPVALEDSNVTINQLVLIEA